MISELNYGPHSLLSVTARLTCNVHSRSTFIDAVAQVTICTTNLPPQTKEDVKAIVTALGGGFQDTLDRAVTHLLVGSVVTTKSRKAARAFGCHGVTCAWVWSR